MTARRVCWAVVNEAEPVRCVITAEGLVFLDQPPEGVPPAVAWSDCGVVRPHPAGVRVGVADGPEVIVTPAKVPGLTAAGQAGWEAWTTAAEGWMRWRNRAALADRRAGPQG